MKAALITEEQIKAIEDTLEFVDAYFESRPAFKKMLGIAHMDKALGIVKSLKVQDPVAWKKTVNGSEITRSKTIANDLKFNVELYAGEQR